MVEADKTRPTMGDAEDWHRLKDARCNSDHGFLARIEKPGATDLHCARGDSFRHWTQIHRVSSPIILNVTGVKIAILLIFPALSFAFETDSPYWPARRLPTAL